MNSDSKHGTCCQCPALMSDGRAFTTWEPHSAFNYRLGLVNQVRDSESLRMKLQENPVAVNINDFDNLENMTCKGKQFFIDSSNFHKDMENAIFEETKKPNVVVAMYDKEYAKC